MVPVTNEHLRASCGCWDAGHLLERTGDMLRKTNQRKTQSVSAMGTVSTVEVKSLHSPFRICNLIILINTNFSKIRGIIQNACYFLFSTALIEIFHIKYVYIVHKRK